MSAWSTKELAFLLMLAEGIVGRYELGMRFERVEPDMVRIYACVPNGLESALLLRVVGEATAHSLHAKKGGRDVVGAPMLPSDAVYRLVVTLRRRVVAGL